MSYDHKAIEKKWAQRWQDSHLYKADDFGDKPKYYSLVMFPYPSGDLHIGHWFAFSGPDIHARYKRMTGFNVMHPFGFDAFGLPAENAAIKRGLHPDDWTQQNIASMTKQIQTTGMGFDWSRMVNTSSADYYKWTQWLFLQFYKKGLVYRAKAKVNWCEQDQTVLANEQVENGLCWRCGNPVVQKDLEQWFFKITDYADELISGLDQIDWPERTKSMQRNWIGRSEGLELSFSVEDRQVSEIRVYTTKPETLFGVTYLVIAPEHAVLDKLITEDHRAEVETYVEQVSRTNERQRLANEEKTGVFTGSYAIHPLTGARLPIWVGNYVLSTYATGAVMGVPAHDQRDWDFAVKYDLPKQFILDGEQSTCFYSEEGRLINSLHFDGMTASQAKKAISSLMVKEFGAEVKVTYRLRDWLISRQRYWGPPIPMIECDQCGFVPVPEEDLPVTLPRDVDFSPKGTAPLATNEAFMTVDCPQCGSSAKRVAETMDTFGDSSWYFLRYADPHNQDQAFDKDLVDYWCPIDIYVGGAEHTVLHLMYSRFFVKALRDMGYLKFDEPFQRLLHQGMILGPDHQKMSKSKGNVVNPDELVEDFGADAVRMQLAFMGPFDQGGPWQLTGIHGVERFLQKVYAFQAQRQADGWAESPSVTITNQMRQAVDKVGSDIGEFKFNTAVSCLMSTLNNFAKEPTSVTKQVWQDYIKLLAPLAPFLSEELWQDLGMSDSVHMATWPSLDEYQAEQSSGEMSMAVQVNGKVRGLVSLSSGASEDEALALAKNVESVAKHIEGKELRRVVYVPGKILNLVV